MTYLDWSDPSDVEAIRCEMARNAKARDTGRREARKLKYAAIAGAMVPLDEHEEHGHRVFHPKR